MLLQLVEPGQTPEPHGGERKLAIGIDLGTTHSVAAVALDGHPVVMRFEEGSPLIPSVVSYEGNARHVGQEALAKRLPLRSTKRLMGRGAADPIVKQFPQAISGDSPVINLQAAEGVIVTAVEVAAEILRHIKEKAEDALGESVEQAVITVPAYFDDAARTATKDAARLAGLQVLRLINEPTAAALAYGLETQVEGVYAVYDLGGGTFDISLLKLEKGVFQVLATGGDLTLGGDDVDFALCQHFNLDPTPEALQAVCQAKEALSEVEEVQVAVGSRESFLTHTVLKEVCKPLVEKTIDLTQAVLKDAGLKPQDVEGVILVGGSTRLHAVLQAVENLFAKPPLVDINPDQAVALGAAAQAHGLTEGSDNLLLDVIPLSLGLETMGGIVEKILHRNTPIPTMAKQEFTTYQDGQTGLIVHVVQGEREFVDDCRSLASFELSGIPPLPAGVARIEIEFGVDVDGLLTVSAKELTTGMMQNVEVKPTYGLPPEAMAQMLEDSLKHGREDMEKRLLEEARVEAQRLLMSVREALGTDGDLLDTKEYQTIHKTLAILENSLQQEDREEILSHHQTLEQQTQAFAERRMNQAIRSGFSARATS